MLEVGPDDRVEEPGPDDLVGLGAQVHGEHLGEPLRVLLPAPGDLGGERGGGPGVEHVGVGGEAARPAPVGGLVAVGHVGRRVDRQAGLVGDDRVVVVDLAVLGQRVPERDGHAEEPLAADQPVAVQAGHPVLVAGAHVRRLPLQVPAPLQQPFAVGEQADEPLAAGHDLQRPVAVLVELHRVGDRPGLADQVARGPEQADDPAPGLGGGLAGQLVPGRAGGHAVGRLGPGGGRRG